MDDPALGGSTIGKADHRAPSSRRPAVVRAADIAWLAGLAALMLAGVGLAVAGSMNRAFQVDEVQHVHVAYLLRRGFTPYSDFWEGHHLLLHLLLAPVVDPDDPVGSFHRARLVVLALLFGSIAVAGLCARRLAGSPAAIVTVGLLLFQTTFIERGMEVRPDIGVVFCALVALACELSPRPQTRRHVLEALALSFAFLFSNKAVILCFAFGCLWLVRAARERRPSQVVTPMLVWCAPLAAMFGALALLGSLDEYWASHFGDQLNHLARASGHDFSPWRYLPTELSRNRVFVLAAIGGLGCTLAAGIRDLPRLAAAAGAVLLALWAVSREPFPVAALAVGFAGLTGWAFDLREAGDRRGQHAAAGWIALCALLGLWINPFPFPYFFITAIAPLAVVAGALVARLSHRAPGGAPTLVVRASLLAVLGLAAWFAAPRLARKAIVTTDYQVATLQAVHAITAPDEPVFDLVGLYFRPNAYSVHVMTGVMVDRYGQGAFPRMIPELRRNGVTAWIESYRTDWLPAEEKRFLREHFVRWAGPIFVLGADLRELSPGQKRRYEVIARKEYRFEGEGELLVDGVPFTRATLERGWHVLEARRPIRNARLILATAPARVPALLQRPRNLYAAADFD